MNQKKSFVATCAGGLEPLLKKEIEKHAGVVESVDKGAISFTATTEIAYKLCLWSRFASRVLFPIASFEISADEKVYGDEIYQHVKRCDWTQHFDVHNTFAISTYVETRAGIHSRYVTMRAKDAIADFFRDNVGERPNVLTRQPDIRVYLYIKNTQVQVGLDLSGDSLHRRSYRQAGAQAPLKESLAAAMVALSGWLDDPDKTRPLVDPMCGSGTLLIEAGLMFANIAPGLFRTYYGFLGWKQHVPERWQALMGEARESTRLGAEKSWPKIMGWDADKTAVAAAIANIEAAGLTGRVHIERKEIGEIQGPLKALAGDEKPQLICNPPYGERMGEKTILRSLYRGMGRIFGNNFSGGRLSILSSDAELLDSLGLPPNQTCKLYNGALLCYFRNIEIASVNQQIDSFVFTEKGGMDQGDRGEGDRGQDVVTSTALANRIMKNAKKLKKWLSREQIVCYRIYDADIPEFNVAIDVYDDVLHVQEYAPPKTIAPEVARTRLDIVIKTLKLRFGVPARKIFLKVRSRQQGAKQYRKQTDKGRLIEVREGAVRAWVNMTDYIDTGLFLDHRRLRERIGNEAKGKRFLNLFSYTGVATLHAVVGGARSTVSVDMSPTYTRWAKMNLALNGFSELNHDYVEEDCMGWLARTRRQFDLIFLDPPTFSNTKRAASTFDVQSHHVELITLAMKCLEPGGVLYFSNNFRKFKMDFESLTAYDIQDITTATVSPDFQGKNTHSAWRIIHKETINSHKD